MRDHEPDPRRRKRLSSRAVLAGVALMAVSVLLDARGLAPMLVTTVGGLTGFVLVLYGVHVGWLVFYDREPDGPSS